MIKLSQISKEYQVGNSPFYALKNINLSFPKKGLFFIVGKSGSGKSTLLSILGGLLTPSSGSYFYAKKDVTKLSRVEKEKFLEQKVSFVFQDYNLLNDFSLKDNLFLLRTKNEEEISKILDVVGLSSKIDTPVKLLSGGEKQRLAIARALLKETPVVLLDEPTGNLDSKNASSIFSMLKKISEEKLLIVVTHDLEGANQYGDDSLSLKDGEIEKNLLLPQKAKCENTLQKEEEPFFKEKSSSFPFFFQFSYVYSLLKRKWIRSLFSILILTFSLSLTLSTSSLLFYSEEFALKSAFEEERINMSPIDFPRNKIKLKEGPFSAQKTVMQGLNETKFPYFPALNVNAIFSESLTAPSSYVVGIDKGVQLFDQRFEVPEKNEAVISSFIDELNQKKKGIKISIGSHLEKEFSVKSVFDFPNGRETANELRNGALENRPSQKENPLQALILVSKNSFKSFIHSFDSLSLPVSRFLSSPKFSKEQLESGLKNELLLATSFSRFPSDASLEFGRVPTKENEIVLSSSYYARSISNIKKEDLIGKTLYVPSLKEFESLCPELRFAYRVDLADVSKEVVVTGIMKVDVNRGANVYTHKEFYKKLLDEYSLYGLSYFAYGNSANELAKAFVHSPVRSSLALTSMVYLLKDVTSNSLFPILASLQLAFLTISSLFLLLFCFSNIKEREKEIAILKSLGIKERKVSNLFLIMNASLCFIAFALSILLSFLLVTLFDKAFRSHPSYEYSYSILSIKFSHFGIGALAAVVILSLATVFPILKARKMDIYLTLKEK